MHEKQTANPNTLPLKFGAVMAAASLALAGAGILPPENKAHSHQSQSVKHEASTTFMAQEARLDATALHRLVVEVSRTMDRPRIVVAKQDDRSMMGFIRQVKQRRQPSMDTTTDKKAETNRESPEQFWHGTDEQLALIKDNGNAENARITFELARQQPWYGPGQLACLDQLWYKESHFDEGADNASGSGAYGIPQALPGHKMAEAGPNWETNPRTQVAWGLDYITQRYGDACSAWEHSEATNWY